MININSKTFIQNLLVFKNISLYYLIIISILTNKANNNIIVNFVL